MSQFTEEQQKAYNRFIKARDRIRDNNGYVGDSPDEVLPEIIPPSNFMRTVDNDQLGHPLFEVNDAYMEYQEAFKEWLRVEPRYRDEERMRASRGDYGKQDNWDEPSERISDLVQLVRESR